MKEIYLYSGIYSWTAENLIKAIDEAKGQDIVLRVNSGGGDVWSGWGIAKKLMEHDGKVHVKVDGLAASMAAFLLLFADSVEAMDVSNIMLHRANGYAETDEEKRLLADINQNISKKLKSKIDAKKFKELTGDTVDSMFTAEQRKDYWISPKQAKAMGLVDKVVKLATAEENSLMKIAAQLNTSLPTKSGDVIVNVAASTEHKESSNLNHDKMTKEEFKSKHPEAYAALYNDIVAQVTKDVTDKAVKAERDRIGAWMKFHKVDPEAVAKGIEDGSSLMDNQTVVADLMIKMNSPEIQEKLKAESAKDIKTEDGKEKPGVEGEVSDTVKKLDAELDKAFGVENKETTKSN